MHYRACMWYVRPTIEYCVESCAEYLTDIIESVQRNFIKCILSLTSQSNARRFVILNLETVGITELHFDWVPSSKRAMILVLSTGVQYFLPNSHIVACAAIVQFSRSQWVRPENFFLLFLTETLMSGMSYLQICASYPIYLLLSTGSDAWTFSIYPNGSVITLWMFMSYYCEVFTYAGFMVFKILVSFYR